MGKISQPEPINDSHITGAFKSGENTLDDWLKYRALDNDHRGASRTFVIQKNNKVIGYYSLATGSISTKNAPGRIRRNIPNPIPVMILGRLAVHQEDQGIGLGRSLLKDAVLRTIKVSADVGIKALLIHAISDSAKHFYKRFGLCESLLEPMALMLSLNDIE